MRISEYLTQDQKRLEKELDKLRALEDNELRELFSHPAFARFVIILMDITNFNGNNYTGERGDTDYLLGRASVFGDILPILDSIDPTMYPRILLNRAKEIMENE